jgi:hypothetical protein
MDMNTTSSPRPPAAPDQVGWHRPVLLALATAGLIALFYWLREHWDHVLGLTPYLLLLACPLMHLLHGHGGHGRHEHGGEPRPGAQPRELSHETHPPPPSFPLSGDGGCDAAR